MPERMANICCGCGRSGFSSGSRQSCNGFVCPHRPDQSAKVDQRQPSRELQSHSSVFSAALQHHRERNCYPGGAEILAHQQLWGQRRSDLSTSLRSTAPQPPTPALWRKQLFRKSESSTYGLGLKQEAFSSRGWWLTNIRLPGSPAAEAATWCFSGREFITRIFWHELRNLWIEEDVEERKTGGWGAKEAVPVLLGVIQAHLVWSPKSC